MQLAVLSVAYGRLVESRRVFVGGKEDAGFFDVDVVDQQRISHRG
jgi:hypothetical protein